MKPEVENQLEALLKRRPELSECKTQIIDTFNEMERSLTSGGKLLVCGNGGSAADALHFVGELVKGFEKRRDLTSEQKTEFENLNTEEGRRLAKGLQQPIRAVSLCGSTALSTAITNDNGAEFEFAQQLYGLGKSGDVFFGISTSGNSENVVMAAQTAKVMGIRTVALVGRDGGKLANMCDVAIIAPGANTPIIQESHLPIYHTLCLMLEDHFFQK